MNYFRLYDAIIDSQLTAAHTEYTEIHHIVPRCLGGCDDISNLVEVEAKAHFILHWLLVKMYPDNKKLSYAFRMMMVNGNGQHRYTSHSYKYARISYVNNHPMKEQNNRDKVSASLKKYFADKVAAGESLQRMCVVSFCGTCGKSIPNRDVVYCSFVCRQNNESYDEYKIKLAKAHSIYCQSDVGRAQRSKTTRLVYSSMSEDKKKSRANKIKAGKQDDLRKILSLTDKEFYDIIITMNPYCKDGKRRNGNVVYRLKLRGIDVERYYDELGRTKI